MPQQGPGMPAGFPQPHPPRMAMGRAGSAAFSMPPRRQTAPAMQRPAAMQMPDMRTDFFMREHQLARSSTTMSDTMLMQAQSNALGAHPLDGGSPPSRTPPSPTGRRSREEIERGVPRRHSAPVSGAMGPTGGAGAPPLPVSGWRGVLGLPDVPDAQDMARMVQGFQSRDDTRAMLASLAASRQGVSRQFQSLMADASRRPGGLGSLIQARDQALHELADAERFLQDDAAWRFRGR